MLDGVRKIGKAVARHPEAGWYSLLAIVVMGPMLLRGYVLTFDMVFTPKLPAPMEVSNTYLFEWLLHTLNFVISGEVIEKVVIFVILLLCGIGMHRLVTAKAEAPRYFAGIFYTINPFTYERWMAGHYLLLAGYALLPFLVRALADLYTRPNLKGARRVMLWYSAIALVSVHMLVLAALVGIIMFAVYLLAQSPKQRYYRHMWMTAGGVVLGVVLINSYWLIGMVSGHSPISRTIGNIGSTDINAFTTASNTHAGLFFNVASLYGFWLERFQRYAMPNHILFVWFGGFALLCILIAFGLWRQWQRRSLLALSLGLAGIIGLVLALGVHAPLSGPLTGWIITHVPLMRGFREPQKFSALLVLAYAYFAAWGLDYILKRLPARAEGRIEFTRDAALLLPVLYVATMPFGFAKQLKPVHYPASWYGFNRQLQQHPAKGKILFLPWHEYMSFDFSPRIIANPAPDFFTAPVIAGTNAQFGGSNDPSPTPTSTFITKQVLAQTRRTDLGAKLASRHVQYVLLAGGYDYQAYGWLGRQSDLKLVSRQPGLNVYKNQAYHD